MNGYWESWITKAFINTIQPGWVVYDVGASWGYYSILFWELVGHSGRVFSVEPHARALELLPQSIQVNGFTPEIVSRAAWGASNESIGFHALTHFQGGSAVSPTGKETVQTIRLDELPYTPNLIKLDVEGAEHHVWEGLGVILDTPGIIIAMEVGRRDYGDTFLHKVKDRFKLRAVTPESTLRNITIDEIQALGDGAWEMLWLTR
jgi:FkbM family methyltransferase